MSGIGRVWTADSVVAGCFVDLSPGGDSAASVNVVAVAVMLVVVAVTLAVVVELLVRKLGHALSAAFSPQPVSVFRARFYILLPTTQIQISANSVKVHFVRRDCFVARRCRCCLRGIYCRFAAAVGGKTMVGFPFGSELSSTAGFVDFVVVAASSIVVATAAVVLAADALAPVASAARRAVAADVTWCR